MLKKIISLIIIYIIFSFSRVFSASIPIESVFTDIWTDYKYYNELQLFFDRWMISPDENWQFSPLKLLNRDEFVWISMEVICKNCIMPDADLDLINMFAWTIPFYDLTDTNKYFYCIAEAKDKWYVRWYDPSYTCEDGTFRESEVPFCPNNIISLEESIAVVLRNSWIFTSEDNDKLISEINSWISYPDLADDVSATLSDWSANSFYWYLKKALEFDYVEIDQNWNEKSHKLIEIVDWKIRPKKAVTKEEFLNIAYIALKSNSCMIFEDNSLAIEIDIYDKECSQWQSNCSLSDLQDTTNTYDFSSTVEWICQAWIDTSWYLWRFYKETTWEQVVKTWKYLDNYSFLSAWIWRVYLTVIDNCWNTWEAYNTISISWDNDSWVSIWVDLWADNLVVNTWEEVTFDTLIEWWAGPYSCTYDYQDWNNDLWNGEDQTNSFSTSWSYEVSVICTDANWNSSTSTLTIEVKDTVSWWESIWLNLLADKLVVSPWENISFTTIIEWWVGPYVCEYNYSDWWTWSWWWELQIHSYNTLWSYEVSVICTDANWDSSSSTVTINVTNPWDSSVWVDLWADKLVVNTWEEVTFDTFVDWWIGPYSCTYDYQDWNTDLWNGEDQTNSFSTSWSYEVSVICTDANWDSSSSTVTINVTNPWDSSVWVDLWADKLLVNTWEEVTFDTLIEWWAGPYSCTYDYQDWNNDLWNGEDQTNSFSTAWSYEVLVICTDSNWDISSSKVTIKVEDPFIDNGLNVSIKWWPIYWPGPLKSDFEWVVSWWEWPYDYNWSFGDLSSWFWSDVSHIYTEQWYYEVKLIVTDKNWKKGEATVLLLVVWTADCSVDSDSDWINDCDDLCPLIWWDNLNNWCPIISNFCNSDCSCPWNYVCNTQDKNICSTEWICVPKDDLFSDLSSCLSKSANSYVYGNVSCSSCPCNSFIDFRSTLRKCDLIFPAITSPDWTEIYSKWNDYIIE